MEEKKKEKKKQKTHSFDFLENVINSNKEEKLVSLIQS